MSYFCSEFQPQYFTGAFAPFTLSLITLYLILRRYTLFTYDYGDEDWHGMCYGRNTHPHVEGEDYGVIGGFQHPCHDGEVQSVDLWLAFITPV